MNILYLGDAGSWHNALWVQYFCQSDAHRVYLFSDHNRSGSRARFPDNMTIIESGGLLGWLLNIGNKPFPKLRHINKLASLALFRWQVKRLIRKYNIDIVHCHTLYYGYLGAEIPASIPVIFTPLGSSIIIHAQQPGLYQHMAKRGFARADMVTADSKLLQDKGIAVGAKTDHNHIVQFGVDQSLFYPKNSDFRANNNIADDCLLLFSPRAIDDIYNIDVLLQALALLKQQGVVFRCMFTYAFGNQNFAKLKAQAQALDIEDCLIWLGFLQYQDMPDVYNASDIVISVPSSDSSPKSVYEAMSCRKPCILSELPWSREILRSGSDFLAVPVRDAEAIAQQVRYLQANPQQAEAIAESGFQQALAHYGYQQNMAMMESLMQQMLESR